MSLISQLTEAQRGHMTWRLDAKTACGLITAQRLARLKLGDLDVADVFVRYGGCTRHSARCHAAMVRKFAINEDRSKG